MAEIIQLRRDMAANWTSANTALAHGELGVESDTLKIKIGDGQTAWTALDYLVDPIEVADALLQVAERAEATVNLSSSGGTLTVDCITGTVFLAPLTENVTVAFSNVPTSGSYSLTLKVTKGSNRSLTWPSSVKWLQGAAPAISSDNGAVDIFALLTHDGGSSWYAKLTGQGFS